METPQTPGKHSGRARSGLVLHRLSFLMLLLLTAVSVASSVAAQRLVELNEARLLREKADDIASLFDGLGSSYEAQLSALAVVPNLTNGDIAQFEHAVATADDGDDGGWALLEHVGDGYVPRSTSGPLGVDLANLPAGWVQMLDRAHAGEFVVLGVYGEGMARRLALAAGRPGTDSHFVVYNEMALVEAAASATWQEDTPDSDGWLAISELQLAIYLGERTEAGFLFGTPVQPGGDAEEVSLELGGTRVFIVVDSAKPLAGSLADRLPMIILGLGLAVGLAIAAVIELVQRRRDDAWRLVGELEAKNSELDRALADQMEAEQGRRELEVELRQAQRLEAIGQLAGGVAHDFNNLLAAILSYADLLSDDLHGEALDDVEEIRQAAKRGAALTRQLLQFSRREAGETSVTEVNDVVIDLSRLLHRTLGEDLSLDVRLSVDPIPTLIDPRELEQVLLNLVVNARDASDAGSTITVATTIVDVHEDTAYPTLGSGPYVRLTVADQGSGMTDDVLARAFEPFFTTKARGQGTGLGLATAYGVVQRAGGHIGVHSTVGVGTEIDVLLPLAEDASRPRTEPDDVEHQPAPWCTGWTVLVVEDEPPVRRAVRRMLERSGYRVMEAEDGTQALSIIDSEGGNIDLLLTDLIMPGAVNGADVAERLRAERAGVPVVYITGYGADILERRGIDATEASVLDKPFSERELLDTLGHALRAQIAVSLS